MTKTEASVSGLHVTVGAVGGRAALSYFIYGWFTGTADKSEESCDD